MLIKNQKNPCKKQNQDISAKNTENTASWTQVYTASS